MIAMPISDAFYIKLSTAKLFGMANPIAYDSLAPFSGQGTVYLRQPWKILRAENNNNNIEEVV